MSSPRKIKKILAITGIRSEYDILSSVLKAIEASGKFDLGLFVTGAHLSPNFGNTVEEIRKDGFKIVEEFSSLIEKDDFASRPIGLGKQLQGLVATVEKEKPDLLLVVGDREESITTALAGTYLNVPIAHISGGDRVIGNIDDQVRHAVTKLSHLHFVTNEESKERVLKLGEQPFRVFNTGNPGLDRLVTETPMPLEQISKELGFSLQSPFLLVLQHPLSSEAEHSYEQMKTTLQAIQESGCQAVIIQPNSDAGNIGIVQAIEEVAKNEKFFIAKNLPRKLFTSILFSAGCLVGNSSLGLLEAPLIKLSVINVGNRQKGRLHAENVIFTDHDVSEIKKAIQLALEDADFKDRVKSCGNPYGDGHAAEKICRILEETILNEDFLIKDITY